MEHAGLLAWALVAYLGSGFLFILALRGLRSPPPALTGVMLSQAGTPQWVPDGHVEQELLDRRVRGRAHFLQRRQRRLPALDAALAGVDDATALAGQRQTQLAIAALCIIDDQGAVIVQPFAHDFLLNKLSNLHEKTSRSV